MKEGILCRERKQVEIYDSISKFHHQVWGFFFPRIYLDHYSTFEDLEAIDWQEESSIKLANLRFLQHAILLFKQRNKNALLYLVEHCAHPALQMQNTNMGNDTFGYLTVPTSC